jgi:hypothetical protein
MKTKNLLLGIFALTFAPGSAMAALLVTSPDYIRIQTSSTSQWTCIQKICLSLTQNPCTVIVNRTKTGVIGITPVFETSVNSQTCHTAVLGDYLQTNPLIVYDAD